MIESIISDLSRYDSLEWLILITGLFYVAFSVANKPICWVFGMVSCAALAYKDFTVYKLIFDGFLQCIYVVMSLLGLYRWLSKSEKSEENVITTLTLKHHISALVLGTILSLILVFFINFFFDPAYAIWDSITAIFSIWATILLINRFYEHWIYWIVIDIAYVVLYYKQGGELVAFLYCMYTLASILGLVTWGRLMANPKSLD